MHLDELIVQGRVGDRGEMKNGVELLVPELFGPIERCQVLGDEIAAIAGEILEIAGAEVIDHREARVRKSFLQRKREIGADKASSASDDQV